MRPVNFCGVECDRGSHRVHRDADPLLREISSTEQWLERPRSGQLILGGRTIPYPPSLAGFLRGLGPRAAAAMAAGFLTRPGSLRKFRRWEEQRARVPNGSDMDDEGFEAFVSKRVGASAFRRFYGPYVEKVWGEAAADLSRSLAKKRISTTSPLRLLARRRVAPGDRSFLYPRRGMAGLLAQLRQLCDDAGVQVSYGRRADLAALASEPHEYVLYSGRLGDLVAGDRLAHRGLYLIHLAVRAADLPSHDTWYTPEACFWFGRISRLDYFSPELAPTRRQDEVSQAVLCIEIPEGRWGRGRDFLAELDAVREQLDQAGVLARDAPVFDARQTFVPDVYPLYRRGWFTHWQRALADLGEADPRILPIGRQGLFLHCNIDHCVRIADDAVRHLADGGSARRWAADAHRYVDLRVRD